MARFSIFFGGWWIFFFGDGCGEVFFVFFGGWWNSSVGAVAKFSICFGGGWCFFFVGCCGDFLFLGSSFGDFFNFSAAVVDFDVFSGVGCCGIFNLFFSAAVAESWIFSVAAVAESSYWWNFDCQNFEWWNFGLADLLLADFFNSGSPTGRFFDGWSLFWRSCSLGECSQPRQ